MQKKWGASDFAVVGVTAAGEDKAREFPQDAGGNFPALAIEQAAQRWWEVAQGAPVR